MTQPRVSIIIPTYNMRQSIGEAVDSALAQTYPNSEIIVVDDGSTDGTGDFLRARYGDKIRIIYQENRGRGAARNVGFAASRGQYIQFFDADDIMEPSALETRVSFLEENPDYAAAYGSTVMFYDGKPNVTWIADRHRTPAQGNILRAEIHEPFLQVTATLVRRMWIERVGGMDETLERNEDWHFWLKIAAAGGLFAYLDGPPVTRYRRPLAISVERATMHHLCGLRALEKIKPLLETRLDYPSLNLDYAVAAWQYKYGVALLNQGNRAGRREIRASLRRNRTSLISKLVQLGLSYVLPPQKVEPTYLALRRQWFTKAGG